MQKKNAIDEKFGKKGDTRFWNMAFQQDLVKQKLNWANYRTVCPRSSDPFHIVSYFINTVTTFWTHSILVTTLRLNFD